MHVMAINGSPRKEKRSTNHILDPLLEGMQATSATPEVVHLGHLQIKPCLGCFLCWDRTPGKCVQQNDMATGLERPLQADLLVFGTPLYHYNVSGLMKNFIDRTVPSFEPRRPGELAFRRSTSRRNPCRSSCHTIPTAPFASSSAGAAKRRSLNSSNITLVM